MARFTFFIGKGGVGKTTVSSAYALHRASREPRKQLLLLSTDPAHSLADVLQIKLGDSAKRLRSAGRAWARQLDAERQIKQFLLQERGDLLALLSKGSLFTADELEPLLDTSLPGMAEVAALLAIYELLDSDYGEVIVDTAPMGHAIRLFQMPEHFARFLEVLEAAAARDEALARQFGGRVPREPALQRWAQMVKRVEQALSAEGSRVVLVTTPEPFSLNEALRSAPEFQQIHQVVLNRAVTNRSSCAHCGAKAHQAAHARQFLAKHFRGAKVFIGDDPGCPILGITALRTFGKHIFEGSKLGPSVRTRPASRSRVRLEPAEWPRLETPLTLTLGKGGVGKTTISAALAYLQRRSHKSGPVTICSIDPAPSLDDIFQTKIGDEPQPVLRDRRFLAAEFDAMAQFRRWTDDLRTRLRGALTSEDRGLHLDLTLDRNFLLALLDVVPPGVDEIFAIFQIFKLLQEGGHVVIDMAPTGHALEVLQTPGRLLAWSRLLLKTLAAHRSLPLARDAAVEIAALSQNVRELSAILRDPKRSSVVVVTLPEPLPTHETRSLLRALSNLEAPVQTIFVNRVLMHNAGRCSRCKLTMEWQAAALTKLRQQLRAADVLVSQEMSEPVAGARGLQEFTGKVWRLK